jgi:hypothetical protein
VKVAWRLLLSSAWNDKLDEKNRPISEVAERVETLEKLLRWNSLSNVLKNSRRHESCSP